MNKTDKIIFGSILGAFFPFLFALIAVGIGFYVFEGHGMPFFFAAGLLVGLIADLLLIKRLLANLFDLPFWLLAGFYILCNVFIYGVFMGFPVFNLLMGIVAGYYCGRRISELKNMLGLNFVPSNGLITGGIISGGIALIIFQYLITLTVQIKTLIEHFRVSKGFISI